MNKATKTINQLLEKYCSLDAIAKITKSKYFCNAIINFNQGFMPYLKRHYHVRIIKYSEVLNLLKRHDYSANESEMNNLCLFNDQHYRFLNVIDVGIIKAIIRKYYQDSGEINLRINLLFDSKIGTKYLSKITGIDSNLISKVRHNNGLISHLDYHDRIILENVYLNSRLAHHLRKLRVNFKV